MSYSNFIVKILIFLILFSSSLVADGQQPDLVTYKGKLQVGKNESTIIYLGEETGDLAAFCFANKSAVGRALLSKCKNGEVCKFSGRVKWGKACKFKGNFSKSTEIGDFSAEAKIVSVKSVRKFTYKKRKS